MITVDDGYRDNLTRMLPLLEKYGYKAVVCVVTGGDHNRWDVEHPTHPDTPVTLMTPDEIQGAGGLRSCGEIGAIPLTHPPEYAPQRSRPTRSGQQGLAGVPIARPSP